MATSPSPPGSTPGEKVLGPGALFVQFADSLEH